MFAFWTKMQCSSPSHFLVAHWREKLWICCPWQPDTWKTGWRKGHIKTNIWHMKMKYEYWKHERHTALILTDDKNDSWRLWDLRRRVYNLISFPDSGTDVIHWRNIEWEKQADSWFVDHETVIIVLFIMFHPGKSCPSRPDVPQL